MSQYRTEVLIPTDRYLCLQLPSHLPAGRATVTITIQEADASQSGLPDDDPDRQDIEWWEEFEDECEPVAG